MDCINTPIISVKTILFRLLLSFLLLIVVFELVLRVFFVSPSRQMYDADLGWQYIPNSSLTYSTEGYGYHQLNELGLNSKLISELKNPDKIFVLGDSFTEALEVSSDKNYVSLLDESFKDIDFINVGRGGYSPLHQLVVIKRMVKLFKPSKIVFMISIGDLGDIINSPYLLKTTKKGAVISLEPKGAEKDRLKDNFRIFIQNSSLLTYLMRRHATSLKKLIANVKDFSLSQVRTSFKGKSLDPIEAKKQLNLQKKAFLSYILKELKTYAPLVVMYVPNVIYKSNGKSEITSFSRNEVSLINEVALSDNVEFYDLSSVFINNYKDTGHPAFGFHNTQVGGIGHLNELGHKLTSKFITKLIK